MDKEVKKYLRKIVFAFSAVIFLLFGVFFVSSGLVEGISLSLPRWVAYCIVGAVLGVIGVFILLIGMTNLARTPLIGTTKRARASDETRIAPVWSTVDTEIEEVSQRVLLELESASSTDLSDATYARMILHLSDVHYTKRILQQVESIASEDKREVGKRAVIKVLLLSTWLQRLYFIIRSFIMGEISAVITTLFILYFGTIDVVKGFIIGIFVFVFALVITRLFDAQITQATKKIVGFMAGHRTIRDFIMNHF